MSGREWIWKLETTVTGMLSAFVAQKLIRTLFKDGPQGQGS